MWAMIRLGQTKNRTKGAMWLPWFIIIIPINHL
jgi:hypothetical protein